MLKNLEPGPVNTNCGRRLVYTNWGFGLGNTNWGLGLLSIKWELRFLNTNWRLGIRAATGGLSRETGAEKHKNLENTIHLFYSVSTALSEVRSIPTNLNLYELPYSPYKAMWGIPKLILKA